MLRGLVLEEVVSTNKIETIHSTRRQIKETLEATDSNKSADRRFRELARLYMTLIDGNAEIPETPEEILAIYDKVMDGEELAADEIPNGQFFRADGVDVGTLTKVYHQGLYPESKI